MSAQMSGPKEWTGPFDPKALKRTDQKSRLLKRGDWFAKCGKFSVHFSELTNLKMAVK